MNSKQRIVAALSGRQAPDRVPWVEQVVHANVIGELVGRSLSNPLYDDAIDAKRVREYYSMVAKVLVELGLDGIGCPAWTPTIADPVFINGQTVPGARQPGIVDWESFNKRTKELPRPRDFPLAQYVDPWCKALEPCGLFQALIVGMQYRMLEVSVGFENMAIWAVEQPELLHACAGFFCDWTCEAIRLILDRCRFDAVWLDDDLAFKTGTFVSPAWLREYTFPYHRRIVDLARSYGLPTLYHSDGNLFQILDDLIATGFVSLHPLERLAMDIRDVKKTYGHRITLMGNVDIDFLERGEPEKCYEEASDLIRDLGPERFILTSGNCITANVKVENLRQMARAVRDQRL